MRLKLFTRDALICSQAECLIQKNKTLNIDSENNFSIPNLQKILEANTTKKKQDLKGLNIKRTLVETIQL
jgi:uncharacterized protein YajQ (UPF0234 family)